ncbi:lysozyme inhibitor LprI family protein [Leptolyngbya sp. FACHB-261]|uniref:lysozyme inhibitor LprI family protein n=1 Tax=Leptolyngbya sp. FACHB-261 TaxID=2692806 RepID=UPI0016894832|nr:lysozyme inhibitor LprI family protein [Leptolyngbya sp. FACHB-261]MBD2104003.1 DUF1311 domain-containing protein [Leptolyngbya sp. FACHB-261]
MLRSISLAVVVAFPLVLTPTRTLLAQQPDCKNPQGTPEVQFCAQQAADAADRQLNQVYQRLIRQLSAAERSRLVAAQRSWIQYRDDACESEGGGPDSGTGQFARFSDCVARLTRQRTTELQRYPR